MSGPLLHSPARIAASLLADAGLVTLPSGTQSQQGSWPCFAEAEPQTPDDVVTTMSPTGRDQGRNQLTGRRYERYGLMVRIRSTVADDGSSKMNAVKEYMDQVGGVPALGRLGPVQVTMPDGTAYSVGQVTTTPPRCLGPEAAFQGQVLKSNRTIYVLNATFTAVLLAAGEPPTITGVDPPAGTAGDTVVMSGSGFSGVTDVTVDGFDADSYTVLGDDELQATLPLVTGGNGPVDLVVTNGVGSAGRGLGMLAYYPPPPPPPMVILSILPASGPMYGGTKVTITGVGFPPPTPAVSAANSPTGAAVPKSTPPTVQIGFGLATNVKVDPTGTQITCVTPPNLRSQQFPPAVPPPQPPRTNAAGQLRDPTGAQAASQASSPYVPGIGVISVFKSDGSGSTAGPSVTFTYGDPGEPTITSIAPASGPAVGGYVVTVKGTGLLLTSLVTFGGVAAPKFEAPSDTILLVTVPKFAVGIGYMLPSTVDVIITNPGGSSVPVPPATAAPSATATVKSVSSAAKPTVTTVTSKTTVPKPAAPSKTQFTFV